ncbi:hypothetical protein ZHAS_00005040 [Anopheles sinensis]|uniref:Uncharacterized protein n=1 Tax=Anopheles sinensis TaxID=74873 RepID=A0A084VID4_ANOSI|nr:hypothetical protein ZHAS_00005040 [Anopheles sinensis]
MSSERRWKDTFRVDFSAWASKPTREEVITLISKMIMAKECVVRTHLSQVNQTVYVQMSSLEQAQEVVERCRGKHGKKINGVFTPYDIEMEDAAHHGVPCRTNRQELAVTYATTLTRTSNVQERLHKEKPTRTQQAGVSEKPAPTKKAPEITISKSPSPARDPVAAETSAQNVSVPVHTPAQPPPADNSVLEPMADNATEDSAMQTVPGGLSVDDIVFDIPLDSSSVSPTTDETITLAGVKRPGDGLDNDAAKRAGLDAELVVKRGPGRPKKTPVVAPVGKVNVNFHLVETQEKRQLSPKGKPQKSRSDRLYRFFQPAKRNHIKRVTMARD